MKRIVISLILIVAILLSACAVEQPGSADLDSDDAFPLLIRPQNEKFLREDEWLRMLTLAISFPDQRDYIWNALPQSQRSEISQADFIQYISFLTECLPGTIISFSKASMTESDTIRGHANKSDKQLNPKPEQASIWWIKARTSDLRELKFAVPVTLDDNGTPYFSKTWLRSHALLFDYIVLYFDALSNGSKDALIALIGHNLTIRSKIQQLAIGRRADELLLYYRDHISSGRSSYRCVEMMPGYAVIEQQSLSTEPGTSRTRSVVFTEVDAVIRAEEKIPQQLTKSDGIFSYHDATLFDLHQAEVTIDSDKAIALLGTPLDMELLEDAQGFRVTWPGLIVEAAGTCDIDAVRFSGSVHQISISYSAYQTGTGLKPGDFVYELYYRYPFVRENGYLLSLSEHNMKKTLAIQVEADYIARMTIILNP